MDAYHMKRRQFLQVAAGAAAAGYAFSLEYILAASKPDPTVEKVAGLPRRQLGRTGRSVSIVTFPGLALHHVEQEQCNTAVRQAFERGVNFFDVAPAYGNGVCETKLGIALQGVERDKIFLACKTKKRDAAGARAELENSLKQLKTDRFDLYQMHHLVTEPEVRQALGPGGALETILQAREQGKIKYIGFSAHTTKAALAVMAGFRFDTVMFPINFTEYLNRGFGKAVLEEAKAQGAGVISIKPMSRGAWPKDTPRARNWWYRTTEEQEEVTLALRFAWSQPGVATGVPPSFLDLLDKAIVAAKDDRPVTAAELTRLQELAVGAGSLFTREEERAATASHQPADSEWDGDCPYAMC
jgi:predicted aldo/keto reductase-like oxidoreductase